MNVRARSKPPHIGRRAVITGAAALSAGVAACDGAPPLNIALHPWPGYEFMRLASRSNLVDAPVKIVDTTTVQQSLEMIMNGSVDGAGLTLDQVLGLRRSGQDIAVALVFDVSAGADALLAVPEIYSLGALRGKWIGVERSTLGEIMLAKVLESAGLDRSGIEVAYIDDDHVAAWDRGGLDAIITYDPARSQLRSRGLRQIFDSRRLPRLIFDVLGVRRSSANRKATALRKLNAAHFALLDEWKRSPVDLAYRLATMLSSSPEEVIDSYAGLDLPDAVYNRRYLTPPALEMTAAAQEVAAILAFPVPANDIFVAEFLPGAR
ncbi:ABC transporter substrate-binding protein [Halotia wernerae UHCC 0503]|nr:ABC transporter substrate-binding protein [Halotia wernerae UHCC 0503]